MMIICARVLAMFSVMTTASSLFVGRGIADMTGPAMEVNMMGYAAPSQVAGGIHQRLFARAFVFDDRNKMFAYVSADIGMGSDLLTQKVVERLENLVGAGIYSYENLVVSGTHTHSSAAGFLQYVLFQATSWGFMNQVFEAYVSGIAEAVAAAHADAQPAVVTLLQGELQGANINRSPTSYLLNADAGDYDSDTDLNMLLLSVAAEATGEPLGVLNWFAVHGTSLNNTNRLLSGDNRGYASYLLEQHFNGNTEAVWPGKGAFVAAFASTNLGDVSPNTNGAICVDSGLPCDALTSTCHGRAELCIAFGPGSDMFESAEIIGRKQFDHALDLLNVSNTRSEGSGTSGSEGASKKAAVLDGPIDFVHKFVNMSAQLVTIVNAEDGTTTTASTCRPAMGYAFAAGTTDGAGAFNFHQATNETTLFWQFLTDVLNEPSAAEAACHSPKPILFNLGDMHKPYQWDAEVVPVQLLRMGFLFIASVPCEFTTMAGRRLRSAVKQRVLDSGLVSSGDADRVEVTIAGLANSYSDYVTTYEEYQGQRYEAASTIFGPHTHGAYLQLFQGLVDDMAANKANKASAAASTAGGAPASPPPLGPSSESNDRKRSLLRHSHSGRKAAAAAAAAVDKAALPPADDLLFPPDLYDVQLQAIPDAVAVPDAAPNGSKLGDLLVDVCDLSSSPSPASSSSSGGKGAGSACAFVAGSGEEVRATWWGANPRSDLKRGDTFMTVERSTDTSGGSKPSSSWVVVATDADFATKFAVKRPDLESNPAQIQATVSWQVPSGAVAGIHRLRYFGVATTLEGGGGNEDFEGVSSTFEVVVEAAGAALAISTFKTEGVRRSKTSVKAPPVIPKRITAAPALNEPLLL